MEVYGADRELAGTVSDLWVDRAEPQIRYLEVNIGTRHVLLPINFAKIDGRRRIVNVKSILGSQFATVPSLGQSGPDHPSRGRSDHCLLRERTSVRVSGARRALHMSHDDFEFEPLRGLPALLPEGERLLWQGSPRWQSLAVRAYQVRKVVVYFGILVLWRLATGLANAQSLGTVVLSCAFILLLGGIAFGVLCVLAYLNARSTVYSITSRRVLLRHGVAVPLTMNIPLKFVDSAGLRPFADGTGDIALTLPRKERIGYLITWPHLRPGRITRPQPSLRALVDAKRGGGHPKRGARRRRNRRGDRGQCEPGRARKRGKHE